MKWTIANSSDLLGSLSAEKIIAEKESRGYCCFFCNRVGLGTPHAKVSNGHGVHPVCCSKCLEEAKRMGFLHITQEV